MKTALDLLAVEQARTERAAASMALSVVREGGSSPSTVGKSGGSGRFFDRVDMIGGAPTEKITRPYEQSAWVMRALQLKAGELTSAPLKFYEGDREFTAPDFDAFWQRPFLGPDKRRLEFAAGLQQLAGWMDLEGEYFLLAGDEWLLPFPDARKLSPFVIARPDRMRHVVRGGELLGWVFTDGAGQSHPLLPEQVIHQKCWNPYDDFRGLAPVKAVLTAAEVDYLAGNYVRNLMRNNGDQGVYVIAKNGVVGDPQREQIVTQLREKRRESLRGNFRPVFLTGDITIEDAKAQAPNADLNATRLASRHEIFIGLGIPGSMADVVAAYSIGSASDRYQLITGTCQPQGRALVGPLAAPASRMAGRTLTAALDWDEHPIMQQVRRERIEAALKLWGTGMAMKHVNDYLDLGMEQFPGWDVGYLPYAVAPVGEPAPERDPALDEDVSAETTADDPEVERIRLALLARQRVRRRACAKVAVAQPDSLAAFACACGAGAGEMIAQKARDPKELARWRDLMAKRRESVRSTESRVNRELFRARAEVLKRIDATYRPQKGVVGKAAAADFVFNLQAFREGLFASLRKQAALSLNAAGEQLFVELGRDDPFQFPPEAVLEFARRRENKLSDTPDDIHRRITETLEEGITAGDTTEQLAERVRAAFNGISKERARTIAMTETSAAYGQGREQAMKLAGVKFKQWLTSGNANVRATHAAANGQTVPIDEAFDVGGEYLMHPGDPSGSPENVINCHCVSIAVEGEDET